MSFVKRIAAALLRNLMGNPIDPKDAYQVGYHAPERAENPYPHGTWDWRKWNRGHEDAERDDRAW